MTDYLEDVLAQAVAAALAHVESGGIPFVGVVVDGDRVISEFGVNRVHETGDPTRTPRPPSKLAPLGLGLRSCSQAPSRSAMPSASMAARASPT